MAKTKKTKQKPEVHHETPTSPAPQASPHPGSPSQPDPAFQLQPESPQQFANNSDPGHDDSDNMMGMGVAEGGWGIGTQTSWPPTTAATGPWGFDKQVPAHGTTNTTTSAKKQASGAKQPQSGWGAWPEQKTPAWGNWGRGRESQAGRGGNDGWGGSMLEEDEEDEEIEEYEDDAWGTHTTAGAWDAQHTQHTAGGWGSTRTPATASAWTAQTPSAAAWGASAATPASAWKTATPKHASVPASGWRNWGEEAKRLSKTSVPQVPAGTRTSVNSQQRAQIHSGFPGFGGPTAQPVQVDQHSKQATDYLFQILSDQRQHAPPPQQDNRSKNKQKKEEKAGKHKHSQSEKPNVWGGWGGDGDDALGKGGDDHWGRGGDGDDGWGTASAWGGGGGGGWGDTGWGTIDEEEEYEEDDRRVRFSPSNAWSDSSRQTSLWAKEKNKDTPYSMPSRTLAHAYNGTSTSLHTSLPRSKISEYTNIEFHDSGGAALAPVEPALFGRARKAQDRLHWMFPADKDERVDSLINWIQTLHRFLQSRERGALFTNAAYRLPGENEPAFDWLTFDQLQATRDKIIQESVAMYDPSKQVIVFVFLPSPSGKSVAIWRRRINVPNNTRLMLQAEINQCLAALRSEEQYLVHVDEIPQSPKAKRISRGGALYSAAEVKKSKKKRKWWQFW
ncbi:hypothetical protein D9758_001293 [Tetrapyrgos nigripes]|uniref:CcmS related domain-containing protein n=1 Tax=Tetrapyrgos nigripes TaxID=182062 RepID=A0A8H5LUJ4_9AGAR|nr:hypothetical protein D9758_001293 [Tetrapyrgos nigripes]